MNNLTKEQFLRYASVFNSPNTMERNEAYDQIDRLIKTNPVQFTTVCSSSLQDSQVQEGTTRIILTLLIRALKNGPQDNSGKSIWLNLERQMKDELLTCSFQVVLHPSAIIKKQGADLISTIFCLDRIHDKYWPNIIDSISKNVGHQEKGVREAAIYSLSFICEYTQDNSDIVLSSQEIESLLSGIFNTLKSFSDLTLVAVDGLKFATDFVLQRMHDSSNLETADYVFNILIDLLIKCKQTPNMNIEDLVSGIIICLKDICEGFYTKLLNYKDIIFQKVLTSLSFNPKVINSVFFFFQGILEIEYLEQTDLTANIYQQVQKAVFEFLLSYDQLHFDDEGGSSLTEAAYQLLKSINKIYIQQIIKDNLGFVYTNIEIQNVNNLCASLIVLRSMIQYGDPQVIEEPLQNGFQNFIRLLDNDQEAVINQTMQLFVEVSQYLPEVLYVQQHVDQILDIIKIILSKPQNYSQKNYFQAFNILEYLTENIASKTKNMTKYYQFQIKSLLEFVCDIAFSTRDMVILEQCFTFFFTVINQEYNSSELINYFENFRNMLIQTAQTSQNNDERDQKILCYIEVILNVIILKIINDQEGKEKIKKKQKECIELYEICKEQINLQNELIQEPFELMSTVLLSNPQSLEFRSEVNKYIKNYIYQALKTYDQMEIYIKGVNQYLYLVESYNLQMDSDIDNVFKQILDLLTNKYTINSGEQCIILSRLLNDYIGFKNDLIDQNYLQIVQIEKNQMKQLVFQKIKQLKAGDVQQVTEIAQAICELHLNILHYVSSKDYGYKYLQDFHDLMSIFVQFIIEYIQVIKNPGSELACLMLGIIIDYKTVLEKNFDIIEDYVKYLIIYLKKFSYQEEVGALLSYFEQSNNIKIENIN